MPVPGSDIDIRAAAWPFADAPGLGRPSALATLPCLGLAWAALLATLTVPGGQIALLAALPLAITAANRVGAGRLTGDAAPGSELKALAASLESR